MSAVTNREARLWDQMQHQAAMNRIARERQAQVAPFLRQPNTPEGASGCSQAVVSQEGRAVAARGSRPQSIAGSTTSARAAVSTTAAAPTENPGTVPPTPPTAGGAGNMARIRRAMQIIGQRSLQL